MRRAAFVTLILLTWAPFASAAIYHVDPAHPRCNDAFPGTEVAPLKTITAGLAKLEPGDTLVLHEGIYRESLTLNLKGEPERPITIQAESGARVCLTGADRVMGWRPCTPDMLQGNANAGSIHYADLDWAPSRLYQDRRPLDMAREPNEGWWLAEGGGTHTLIDAAHLTQPAGYWQGARIFFWDFSATTHHDRPVSGYDPDAHELTLAKEIWRDRTVEPEQDRYYVRNSLRVLDRPGEWCVDESRTPARLYLWPRDNADPNKALIEGDRRGPYVLRLGQSENVVIDGLEVSNSLQWGIGTDRPNRNVTVRNCVVRYNQWSGIYMRNAEGVAVRRNVVQHNDLGVQFYGVKDGVIEENDIGWNNTDGIHVSWESHGNAIRRNYVHDHNLYGHADNIQFFRNVTDIAIEDNLLVNAGQNIMASETSDGRVTGNLIVSSKAVGLVLGGNTVTDYTVEGNTLAYGGWAILNVSGIGSKVRRNILYYGQPGLFYGILDPQEPESNHNVFFHLPGEAGQVAQYGRNWPRTWQGYLELSGQDAHSLYVDPQFRNAPDRVLMLDSKRLAEFARDRVCTWPETGRFFKAGDHVEIDFDGVVRAVKEVDGDTVVFEPACERLPDMFSTIANWGEGTDFAYDFALSDGSPALTAGPDGGRVGSTIDFQAYKQGDFDGDGTRDLPHVQDAE